MSPGSFQTYSSQCYPRKNILPLWNHGMFKIIPENQTSLTTFLVAQKFSNPLVHTDNATLVTYQKAQLRQKAFSGENKALKKKRRQATLKRALMSEGNLRGMAVYRLPTLLKICSMFWKGVFATTNQLLEIWKNFTRLHVKFGIILIKMKYGSCLKAVQQDVKQWFHNEVTVPDTE